MDKEKLEKDDQNQVYELGYHLLPSFDEKMISDEVSKIHSLILKLSGNIISEGTPTSRQLAYDISKKIDSKNVSFNKSYFGWIKFDLGKENSLKLKESIDSLSGILRFIIIKTVRENMSYIPKMHFTKKEIKEVSQSDNTTVVKTQISEEEIDKSIDELIIN